MAISVGSSPINLASQTGTRSIADEFFATYVSKHARSLSILPYKLTFDRQILSLTEVGDDDKPARGRNAIRYSGTLRVPEGLRVEVLQTCVGAVLHVRAEDGGALQHPRIHENYPARQKSRFTDVFLVPCGATDRNTGATVPKFWVEVPQLGTFEMTNTRLLQDFMNKFARG